MKTNAEHRSISSGYSLIELLVAMLIGLFLLLGTFQIVQVSSRSYILQKTVQQVQKDGRFATNYISSAIKAAGYSGFYGKLNFGVENLLSSPGDLRWDVSVPVSGFNDVANGDTIAGVTGFIENTDVLLLKGMNTDTVSVISNATSDTLVTTADSTFNTGDIVLVSDVEQASLFQIRAVSSDTAATTLSLLVGSGTPGNSALLSNSYSSDSEIGRYEFQMLCIKSGRNGLPALFKISLENTAGTVSVREDELVSNIRDMQISYGIDNNNDQALDEYHNAADVTDWSQLVSINLVLLAASNEEKVVPEASSFSFDRDLMSFVRDETASGDADRRLKRVFRAYIPLRN